MKSSLHATFAAILLSGVANAQIALVHDVAVPAYIAAAVADSARPPDQVARDANRKPGEAIAFAGLKPGDRVGDFMPGGGYFTRIFSRVVGPGGRVYAYIRRRRSTIARPARWQVPAHSSTTATTRTSRSPPGR